MQHLQPTTTLQGGKYRIERVLGQGGFGITYLARNTVFDVNVAIKEFFMKDENDRDGSLVTMPNSTKTELFLGQKEKFKKEAKRMFAIKNEHIVAVHDLFEENGTAYYVMDYVDGENLNARLKRTGQPMSEEEVSKILPQILDALQTVHDAGIWHLDLKPANIMIDKTGQVKLIDFGASKQLNAQKGGATTSTAISYTNGFAPREQMEQNYDKFGPWTDLYALGATLYNLLTNQRPPLPTDIDDDMSEDKHLALSMPNISDKMKQLILWLMKTNRMQRPKTIQAVKDFKLEEKPKETVAPKPQSETIKKVPETEETKVAEKNVDAEPKPQPAKPKVEVEQPETESSGGGNKAWIWILILIGLFVGLLIMFSNGNSGETGSSSANNTEYVTLMEFLSPIGNCKYTGPVDNYNRPNGNGEAWFDDGRYYKGYFDGGNLNGADAYFKYGNGDTFKGTFVTNRFSEGVYTITSTGEYFTGTFNNSGQPSKGTWRDKHGNVLEQL